MLTIGELSRLSHVSPRMLRHYDALGLLPPEAVGENGYRYYRQEQLSALIRIQWLGGYGFSLHEIGRLMNLEDDELLKHLRQRQLALQQELRAKRELLRQLETDILRLEGVEVMENTYHVILLENPEQKVFSIRKTIGVNQYHELFEQLRREAAARGLTQAGPIQMLYHDPEFSYESSDVEAQMVVARDGPDVTTMPPLLCAAVQHRGSYKNIHCAYDALCSWLAEHTEYRPCAAAMERYLNDPHTTAEEDLETGVLFPVERILN